MNIEEIVTRLETLQAAAKNIAEWDLGENRDAEALREAIALLKTHPDAQQNEPLTLEELRGMDGQPVYVKVIDHTVFANKKDDFDGWGMCRSSWVRIWDRKRADIVHVDYEFEAYGGEWMAYRRPPKEEK